MPSDRPRARCVYAGRTAAAIDVTAAPQALFQAMCRPLVLLALAAFAGCGGADDAGRDDAASMDGGRDDAASMDGGRDDAASMDGGRDDAASTDAGRDDTGSNDAASMDAVATDATTDLDAPPCSGATCDDGNACTVEDRCERGACIAGSPRSCDDALECTSDACDAVSGCTHAPVAAGTECRGGQCDGRGTCARRCGGDDYRGRSFTAEERIALRAAWLVCADFRDADLAGADLSDLDLSRADFRGAILRDASLAGSDLSGARFDGADLSFADLFGAHLPGARFEGADTLGALP